MKEKKLAVIFDMDGVMIDNSDYHFKSWKIFCKKFGIELTQKFFKHHISGRRAVETVEFLSKGKLTGKAAQDWAEKKEFIYRKIYKNKIKPVKDLVKFLDRLKKEKIKIALATSASKENIKFVLSKTKTKKYFKVIVDASHVKKGKPNPEVYLTAAEKLKTQPKNCIVFEDALNGIESAKRARMKVVALATTHRPKEISHADLVIKNFTKINIEKLFKLIT